MGEMEERRIRELTVAVNGLVDRVAALERRVERMQAGAPAPPPGGSGSGDLPHVNLDDARGNPTVVRASTRWKGPSFTGKRFSECSPEFLRTQAEFLLWKAANPLPGKEQFVENDRRDAARALGWAERLERGGGAAPAGGKSAGVRPPPPEDDPDEGSPFDGDVQRDLF